MTMTNHNFGHQLDRRMDVVSEDLPKALGANPDNPDSAGQDASGDVAEANTLGGGQPVFGGVSVAAPKVAQPTSKAVQVQNGPSASMVKP
jgi:hypothetical protein